MDHKLDNQPVQRLVAKKVTIAEILLGRFVKEEGWTPSYILTSAEEKISRVNIIAVVVTGPLQELNYRTIVVDDGSGCIRVRSFEESNLFANITVGQPVLIIGKVREFTGQHYLAPEIIKAITSTQWISLRSLELQKRRLLYHQQQDQQRSQQQGERIDVSEGIGVSFPGPLAETESIPSEKREEKSTQKGEAPLVSPSEKMLHLIRQLDKGDGAEIEDVVTQMNLPDADQLIDLLLKEGEIFQNKPGRVKTL